MKLVIVIMTAFLLQVSASTTAQQLTFRAKNVRLKEVFTQIRKQTGFLVLYNSSYINKTKSIDVDLKNVPLEVALKQVLSGQKLDYQIKNNAIIIKEQEEPSFLDKVVDALTPPIDVRGKILDEGGRPMAGVTIHVKGTSKQAVSDSEGTFYLAGVDEKSLIQISFIGYKTQELPASGSFAVIKMEMGSNELQEVVVAYGKQAQKTITGAITVVNGGNIERLPNRSVDRSLQGLVPGLFITSGTGQPGGGLSNFVMRGIATGTQALSGSTVRNPLIVIDGVPVKQDPVQFNITETSTPISNPMAQLNPNDIESISVLKDASAIALYGSRASNGVILITTKRGKIGKPTLTVQHQTDISSVLKERYDVLNQSEYLKLLTETYKNSIPTASDAYVRSELYKLFPFIANGTDTSFYPAPDWRGELTKKNALTSATNLSFSGGYDKSTYYLNLEYLNQDGVIKGTGYRRASLRYNFENKVDSWIKFGMNNAFSFNAQKYNSAAEGSQNEFFNIVSPLLPIRLQDGNLQYHLRTGVEVPNPGTANPVAAMMFNRNNNTSYRGLSKVYAEVNLLKDFTFTTNLGVDFLLTKIYQKIDPRLARPGRSTSTAIGYIDNRDVLNTNIITTNTLNYNKNFSADHSLSVLVGQEAQIQNSAFLSVSAQGLALPYYEHLSNATTSTSFAGFRQKETLQSFFGKADYTFLDRYSLSSSIRRDGSSRFGAEQQYGTYWSIGSAWVASEEAFIKSAVPFINYLKIRGSVGAQGNAGAIGRYTRYNMLLNGRYLDQVAVTPNVSFPPGNPDVKWEQTLTWDGGIEFRFADERIGMTADIYKRTTKDLIYSIAIPGISGYSTMLTNIGDVENKGVELSLNLVPLKLNSFTWMVNGNWSTNKNKLIKTNVPFNENMSEVIADKEGENFNSFYLREWAGVNQENGMPQFKTPDGVTTDITAAPRSFVGKPQPDGFGSITNTLRFKDLEFSAQFYYQYGNKVFDASRMLLENDGQNPYVNQRREALDYWKASGDLSSNPRRTLDNQDYGNYYSTRYLYDGDYIRFSYASLSYQLPVKYLKALKLSNLKVFVQGNNLALWSKYKGQDPGNTNVAGSTTFTYPNQKTFSIGVNVKL